VTVLITGASGFVGLNLVERLLAAGETVVGLSAAPIAAPFAQRLGGLPGRLIDIVGDVRDRGAMERLMRSHRITQVAHMAAITAAADRERRAADEIVSVNLAGLAAVMTAAAHAGVERFVGVGSVAVYGNQPPDGSLITEDTPHAPQSLYAITKSSGEAVVARLGELQGLDWVIARLGRVFGPHEHDTGVRDTLSQIHQVTAHALAGRAVRFDRPCLKNWNYAPDSAQHLATLLLTARHRHTVYNLGSEHAWTLADWCERLARRLPGFRYHVGGGPDDGAAASIELGGARDSGLLSWQRFADEFQPPPSTGLDAAFQQTLAALGVAAAGQPAPASP
jgi:UDP-glucuronate 4-epimerase